MNAQAGEARRAKPTHAPRDVAREEQRELRLRFGGEVDAANYLRALTSLLFGASHEVTATLSSGASRNDFTASEIADRLSRRAITRLRFALSSSHPPLIVEAEFTSADPSTVTLRAPFTRAPATARTWLQADPDLISPVPALALPLTRGGFALDAAHALVGLALRLGGFGEATLFAEHALSWSPSKPNDDALPLRSTLRDAVWSTSAEDGPVAAWVSGLPTSPSPHPSDAGWWEQYDALTQRPREALDELHAFLSARFNIPSAWALVDLLTAPAGAFAVEPETGTVARLVPEPDRVLAAIDFDQPAQVVRDALLHICAHLALGHVRPGDDWGHWDTAASFSSAPRRVWDREAREYLDKHLARPTRRVTSLEECDAREKAWLVLLDHIGRMVGQTHTLHSKTEKYPAAAYQRQAAQRLVAQLEEYGGAMLCDGVGLGKTYVATTVVVHYANAWGDQLAKEKKPSTDPFRVTVLAPNSVVSTWQREAIPPLAAYGVPIATIRVLSHSKLSRIVPTSDVLAPRNRTDLSDMEHLLLSDLVIVDEAHNFRSVGARRSIVLRDLLRLQPRKDLRRKVLLLTATPVNNSLEDLRQQAALMFGKPLWFNDNTTALQYRSRALKDVEERVAKARKGKGNVDVAARLIHDNLEARFAYATDFRDDLQFGVQVPRVGDYLKEQEKRLVEQQAAVRAAIQSGQPPATPQTRIAGELLDRIVVQRSRALCKQIEREQGSNAKLLFRPDAAAPEKLVYEDVYDDTRDVLARFLPLFEADDTGSASETAPLSLKVYMWADVRDGVRDASDVSSVVGLQRVLVLKRLESSPVAFLITLLRLLALHTHRLKQLLDLCREVSDRKREKSLAYELSRLFDEVPAVERERIDLLLTGGATKPRARDPLARWSEAHMSARAAADSDDPPPPQLDLFERDDEQTTERREQLDRLWELRDDLVRDLSTLLRTAPGLADVVFGRFAHADWPRRFINGGADVDWPTSAAWGMRVVTDSKLRHLVARLLRARKDGQKAIVFSQFTDTLAYLDAVLRASKNLDRNEWKTVLRGLSDDAGYTVSKDEVIDLVARIAVVSGETEERDTVINAFAPFYRLGPSRPAAIRDLTGDQGELASLWESGWMQAIKHPIDVLLATDVLAEGVNLQDAALLINFDVHWNPVRMIQRAGRIDRRLNPAIEKAEDFPELAALVARDGTAGLKVPEYWWRARRGQAPVIVNLLLPEALEEELQLRERIANKTLAIDFTLGLEQGTGAEADWMAEYRYRGISALNAWESDRAIEQIAGYQQRLQRMMSERDIKPAWVAGWNGWLREVGGQADDRIIAWASLGRKGGEAREYTRQIQPRIVDNVPHWLWTAEKPVEWSKNFWLALDSDTYPAATRKDLGFSEDASRPVAAEDLLIAVRRVVDGDAPLEELGREVGRPFQQGASAVAAGVFGEEDRRAIQIRGFRILQLRHVGTTHDSVKTSEDPC